MRRIYEAMNLVSLELDMPSERAIAERERLRRKRATSHRRHRSKRSQPPERP